MKIRHLLTGTLTAAALLGATSACNTDPDTYDIRYVVGINPGDDVHISYQDLYVRTQTVEGVIDSTAVERKIGTVWGGFPARITATVNDNQAPRFIEIRVSLNDGPYEVKASTTTGTSIEYTTPIE